jgi:mRNA interferase HigB
MHVITRKRLSEFAEKHPEARSSLTHWYGIVHKNRFRTLSDCETSFLMPTK